jgi:carbon-monoxide dehydrogenase large subunit
MLELVARDLGLDPAEVAAAISCARGAPVHAAAATSSTAAAIRRARAAAGGRGYAALRREQAQARARAGTSGSAGVLRRADRPGRQFYGVGGAPISGQEAPTLRLEPGGAVTALVGVTEQGQGTHTALAQIIAAELDVPLERVAVRSGDTSMVPYGGGTWASRGMPIGGSATLLAARALGERIRSIAAALLEAHPADVELLEGRALIRGSPERGLSFADLARTVHFRSNELRGIEPSLEATVHYTNPAAWTFTNGAHLAVVDVDIETGKVRVLRYVAVDDCGRIINPALVEGQIAGGVAQGLGGALGEHCVYDEAGQLLSSTLMDYAVPTAEDVPPIETHHIETPAPGIAGGFKGAGEALMDYAVPTAEDVPPIETHHIETPAPGIAGGFKGAGEAGATGAPAAILNAVNDALAPLGVMLTDQPITPARVSQAIRRSA